MIFKVGIALAISTAGPDSVGVFGSHRLDQAFQKMVVFITFSPVVKAFTQDVEDQGSNSPPPPPFSLLWSRGFSLVPNTIGQHPTPWIILTIWSNGYFIIQTKWNSFKQETKRETPHNAVFRALTCNVGYPGKSPCPTSGRKEI